MTLTPLHSHPRRACTKSREQSGFALIAALLIMVPLLLLAASMLRTTSIDEKIAGNTLDKQRAFQSAQSGLEFAEWALRENGSGNTGTTCPAKPATTAVSVAANVLVCNANQFSDTSPPGAPASWAYYMPYQVLNANYSASGTGVVYANPDKIYIYYVGNNSNNSQQYYQVTSWGAGVNPVTVSMVQSVYRVQSAATDLGGY